MMIEENEPVMSCASCGYEWIGEPYDFCPCCDSTFVDEIE